MTEWLYIVDMAFYLKYRPQKISELDITSAREVLYGLLKSGAIPHALLFTGVRGTGKTSSARIFAKALNCDKNGLSKKKKITDIQAVEPCNTCDSCLAITGGSSLDVIEIDAASHRGIDDIRDLREKVKLAPVQSRNKVYIIDEVHMLTTEAFNALLKTLEEPPQSVLFVLCTTEPHKLPDTVRSRCHTVPFERANAEEIQHALDRVIKGENLTVEQDAVAEIARLANGSFRDATKILEEISWHTGPITQQVVAAVVKSPGAELDTVLKAVKSRDSKAIIDWLEQAANRGSDMKMVAQQLIARLHQELLALINGQETIFTESDTLPLIRLVDLLDSYWGRYGVTQIAQLPLELAVLEWLVTDSAPKMVSKPKDSSGSDELRTPTPAKASTSAHLISNRAPKIRKAAAIATDGPSDQEAIQMVKDSIQQESKPVPTDGVVSIDFIEAQWEQLMEAIKPKNFSVEALLRASKPSAVDGDKLVLEVFYPFHYEKLQQDKSRAVVEQCLEEVFGLGLKIHCLLKERTDKPTKVITKVLSEDMVAPQRRSNSMSSSGSAKQAVPNSNGQGEGFRRRVSKQAPVATEQDDELLKFAAEIFGK